jgi:hypothetical protein
LYNNYIHPLNLDLMKKNHSAKTILILKIRARRAIKSKVRFKHYLTVKNKSTFKKSKGKKKRTVMPDLYSGFVRIKAPLNFSLLHNAEKVIDFVMKLKKQFDKRNKVFILMEHVENIDHSAIIILLSIMIRFKAERILFNGSFPSTPEVNNIFMSSGFFKVLKKEYIVNQDRYKFGEPNTIHSHAWKHVDDQLSFAIMEEISPKIVGHLGVYKGLHRVLIELMQNSFNHAEPDKEGEKHWWLSVNLDEGNKVAKFSFVDYGVGIFESLNNKTETSKWYKWKELMGLFSSESNAEILLQILEGKLHQTVTGQDFRGKGLPGIKEAMDRNLISKLFIITNDVFADVSKNNYVTLNNNFQGTFVYWEIDQTNTIHPWIL